MTVDLDPIICEACRSVALNGLIAVFNEVDFRKIDLNLLVVFHALMRERSVTRAAERLFLGASAVSMSLRRLRALFGDELLVRSGSEMHPTPRAEQLIIEVERVLDAVHGLVHRPPAFDPGALRRSFRIGVAESMEHQEMPALLIRLRRDAPGVRLVTRPVDHTVVREQLDAGYLDLAIGVFEDLASWHRSVLAREEHFACLYDPRQIDAPPPLTLGTYLAHDHILVSPRGDLRGVVDDALDVLGKSRRVVAATTRFGALAAYLAQAPLIATLPARMARKCGPIHGLACSELPVQSPVFNFTLAWHARFDEDPAHQWLRQLILDVAA